MINSERHVIYLDFLRIAAAFYVFIFHVKKYSIGAQWFISRIPDHGHDAVILFFVLSGYVIAGAADRKYSLGWVEYFVDRFTRVYTVAVPVLLVSLCIAGVIAAWGSTPATVEWLPHIRSVLVNLFFLGQSWGLKEWVPLNQPYWSLCYEVMYYCIFGAAVFATGVWRLVGVLFFALLAGPKVLLLMPCWLIGVAAYYYRDAIKLNRSAAVVVAWVLPIVVLVLLHELQFGPRVRELMDYYLPDRKNQLEFSVDFLIDYVTALLVAVNIYATQFWLPKLLHTITSMVKVGADMSFTLYLLHMPLIFLAINLFPSAKGSNAFLAGFIFFVMAACYFLSQLTESKRYALRSSIKRYIKGTV